MLKIKQSLLFLGFALALFTACDKDDDNTTPAETLPTVVLTTNSWSIRNTLFTGSQSNIRWADSSLKAQVVATQAGKARISVKFSAGIGDPAAGSYKIVPNDKSLATDEVALTLELLKADGTVDTTFSSTNTSKTLTVTATADTLSLVVTNATLEEKTGKKAYVSAKIKIQTRKISYANWTLGTDKFGTNGYYVYFNTSYSQLDCNILGSVRKLQLNFAQNYNLEAGTFPVEANTGNQASTGKVMVYVTGYYISSYTSTASSGGSVVVTKETGKTKIKITNVTVSPFGAASQVVNGEVVILDQ